MDLFQLFLWVRPWVDWLEWCTQLIERLVGRLPLPNMAQTAIMSDSVNKCAFRTFPAEMRNRLPDGQHNLLQQLFPRAGVSLIAESQPRKRRAILAQDPVQLIFTSICDIL